MHSTDSGGCYWCLNLRSFDVNDIGIEPTDIPPDARLGVTARECGPRTSPASCHIPDADQSWRIATGG
jgi:hypothetical protein